MLLVMKSSCISRIAVVSADLMSHSRILDLHFLKFCVAFHCLWFFKLKFNLVLEVCSFQKIYYSIILLYQLSQFMLHFKV